MVSLRVGPGWDWGFTSGPQAECTANPPEVLLIEHFCTLIRRYSDSVCQHTEILAPKAPYVFLRHFPLFVGCDQGLSRLLKTGEGSASGRQ